MKTLKDAVITGSAISLYANPTFEIDDSQVRPLANIYEPTGLAEKVVPTREGDLESGIAIFEAFQGISPIVATSEAFWSYLTHTELFNYTQNRWPEVLEGTADSTYILTHFFANRGRNAAGQLWWQIKNTVDESRDDKYELSRILFSNNTFRISTFGSYSLIRYREAMLGILGFIADHWDLFESNLESRLNFVSKYFNRLGAVRQLAYLQKDYFYKSLESKIPIIEGINYGDERKDDSIYTEDI